VILLIPAIGIGWKYYECAEPGGPLDAEDICGLSDDFVGGASDLDRSTQ